MTRRLASYLGFTLGAEASWVHNPLGIFCFCAAWTHVGSAVTHVWPDSFTLVRRAPRVCLWSVAGSQTAGVMISPTSLASLYWTVLAVGTLVPPKAVQPCQCCLGSTGESSEFVDYACVSHIDCTDATQVLRRRSWTTSASWC